jgi:hypothetical protein
LALFGSPHSHWARQLDPTVFAMLKPSALYTGLILAALAVVGRNIAARARGASLSVATLVLLTLTAPALLGRWIAPLKAYAENNSSRRLADTILSSPERELPIYGYYYYRTSLPFYLQRTVGLVTTDGNELTSNYLAWRVGLIRRRSSLAAGQEVLPRTFNVLDPLPVDQRRLLAVLEFIDLSRSSPQPRLVLVRNTHVGLLANDVKRVEPLWTGGGYSVWQIP